MLLLSYTTHITHKSIQVYEINMTVYQGVMVHQYNTYNTIHTLYDVQRNIHMQQLQHIRCKRT